MVLYILKILIFCTWFLDLFKNVVTFRIADASIELPTFDMGHSGDIYLEFKTTVQNAVMLHSRGPTDYIKLAIVGKFEISKFSIIFSDTNFYGIRLLNW